MPGNDDAAAEHHRGPTTTATAQYQPPPPPPSTIAKPNPKLLSLVLKALIMSLLTSLFFLFLGVAAIVLLHLCLAGRHFHRSHRRHHHHHQTPQNSDDGSSADVGFSRDDLLKLPRFRYIPRTNSPISGSECVVCLENFREGDLCRSLPGCRHVFHSNCIDSWLVKVPACPLCRAPVRFNSGASGSMVGAEEFKQIWAVGV